MDARSSLVDPKGKRKELRKETKIGVRVITKEIQEDREDTL